MHGLRLLILAVGLVGPVGVGVAVAQVAPDRDRALLPVGQTPPPNGTRDVYGVGLRAALYIRDHQVWSGGRHTVGSIAAPCELVVEAGGTLDLRGSRTTVFGNVVLLPGGLLRVTDGDLLLGCQYPSEYSFLFLGGQLDTLRVSIGGNPATEGVAKFLLDKGLWSARDTVVNYSAGILVGSELGRDGDPLRRGGTLIADGLLAGAASDYVSMSGYGDVTLHNSAFRVSLALHDPGVPSPPVPLHLPGDELFVGPIVYGDPAVHDGTNRPAVTEPITGSPWRLEFVNTTVTKWRLVLFGAGAASSNRTYELYGAEDLSVSIHAEDLSGSPVRSGPWSTFYPPPYELTDLPTTSPPGYHALPPGCGVTIGGVTIRSAPNEWNRLHSWDFYLKGNGSFTATGPTRVGELIMSGDAQVTLRGKEGFDSGLRCVSAKLADTARLVIRDAVVGSEPSHFGFLFAAGQSVVDLDRVRLRRLQLQTGTQTGGGPFLGVDAGTILLGHHVRELAPGETFTVVGSPGGTISVADDELRNMDFEGPVTGNTPEAWSRTNVTCYSSTNVPPSSPGTRSVRYQSSAASGSIEHALTLPARTPVEAHLWVRPGTMPGGSYEARLIDGTGQQVTASLPTSGGWQFVTLPRFTMSAGTNQLRLQLRHQGATGPVSIRFDDVIVRTPGYWESDNLFNLGFEEPRRRHDLTDKYGAINGPDYWTTLHANSRAITTGLRAGATGRAVRLDVDEPSAVLRKKLYVPVPGQQVTVSGWVKPVRPGGGTFNVDLYVATGDRYWDTSNPSTQWLRLQGITQWTWFTLTHTVPPPPEFDGFTTIAIKGGDAGDRLLVDDLTVTIQ